MSITSRTIIIAIIAVIALGILGAWGKAFFVNQFYANASMIQNGLMILAPVIVIYGAYKLIKGIWTGDL
jgi:hypothetical protein